MNRDRVGVDTGKKGRVSTDHPHAKCRHKQRVPITKINPVVFPISNKIHCATEKEKLFTNQCIIVSYCVI